MGGGMAYSRGSLSLSVEPHQCCWSLGQRNMIRKAMQGSSSPVRVLVRCGKGIREACEGVRARGGGGGVVTSVSGGVARAGYRRHSGTCPRT